MDFDTINDRLNRKEQEVFRHLELGDTRRRLCNDLENKFREACESICQDTGKSFFGECVTVAEICPDSHQLISQQSDHEVCAAAHYLYRHASSGDSQSVRKACKSLSTWSEPNKKWLIDELKGIGAQLFKDFGIVEKKLIENPELVEKHRRKINNARTFSMADLRRFTGMSTRGIRPYMPKNLEPPGVGESKTWGCTFDQAKAILENIASGARGEADRQRAEESLARWF